jgi:hypothetical protein
MIEPNYFVGSISYGEYYKASDLEFAVVLLSYNFPSYQIDIQTMALAGNQAPYTDPAVQGILYKFDGENSDWSNTQIITLTQTPTSPLPSPTIPELPWLAIVPMLLSLLSVAWVVKQRKSTK